MTGLDHEHTAAIEQAAQYLAAKPHTTGPRPNVPWLRHMFGLTALEACQAISEARSIEAKSA
jgi:hypothetical protein